MGFRQTSTQDTLRLCEGGVVAGKSFAQDGERLLKERLCFEGFALAK